MTDNDFLAAIIADPLDDVHRLVYADWLEEHDQPERAEFIRVQCELAKLDQSDAHGSEKGVIFNLPTDWPFRENVKSTPCNCRPCVARNRERDLLAKYQGRWTAGAVDHVPNPSRSSLLQLLARDATKVGGWPSDDAMFRFRRGFVDEVRCNCNDWLEHGRELVRVQPISLATLTNKRVHVNPDNEGGYAVWRWGDDWEDGGEPTNSLPKCLWDLLTPEPHFVARYGKRYPTDTEAEIDLSDACLLWARGEAGKRKVGDRG